MFLTYGASPRAERVAAWCRQRPAGSAALIVTAGIWLVVLPFLGTPLALLQAGVAGSAGLGVSLPLLLCGVVPLRFPVLHAIAGVAATALSVLALLTCNLGGLFLGTACGILGGCLAFSWNPPPPVSGAPPAPLRHGPRRLPGLPADRAPERREGTPRSRDEPAPSSRPSS